MFYLNNERINTAVLEYAPKNNRTYYPALDGLRGIAILMILFRHNLDFVDLFSYCWAGVDLFFVLSGFLITDILLQTREKKNYLRNFYIRRVLRIFPIYYLVIILFFSVVPLLAFFSEQYDYYSAHQAFLWTNTQNWLYILYPRPGDALLYHCWSLSLEEQFYLLWPFIVLLIKNTRRLLYFTVIILVAGIILRIASWQYFGEGYTNYHLQSLTRIDGLAIGCILAVLRYHQPRSLKQKFIGLCCFILGLHVLVFIITQLFINEMPHFRFLGYTSLAAAFGLLVYTAITHRNWFTQQILSNKYLVALGKISYGLYLYHWPILVLARTFLQDNFNRLGLGLETSYIIVSILAGLLAIALSWLSFHFFEKRILSLKYRYAPDP